MKTYKYITLLALISFSIACTKELPLPDVEDSPLMVVNSLFSPQEGIKVVVSESCHLHVKDCNLSKMSTAEVRLLDARGNILSVLTHTEDGIYSANDVTIDHGKTYQLEVSDGSSTLKNITTKSSVPMPVKAKILGVEETVVGGRQAWGFDIEIEDDPDAENYYVLEGSFDMLGREHGDWESEINGYIEPHFMHFTDDPNAENGTIAQGLDFETLGLRGVYISDKNFNGQKYITKVGVNDEDLNGARTVIGNLIVKSVSKEMFEYMVSLEEYRLLSYNPFSDPIQLYSNINDGIGIFAGYTQEELSMQLPPSEYWFDGINIENSECTAPCTVKFTAHGGSKMDYFWEFGDGGTSSDQVTEHRYEQAGEYIGSINASGNNGGVFQDFSLTIK